CAKTPRRAAAGLIYYFDYW
nr:immunoglobulin heavy chain junction region [Macaca mulatta]MOV49027.1 immunoglobulin heavy chain junction region [Macaca mulatta]MOV49570.1 immunoglobulin heavy chain junction region [Macaca mulatta]MOV49593.1 immunoglobulin heavy chain junction region [Macaca mulatta]MOV49768.1 immunoglobulin heavy chain junction region [Macaca mulatta]